MDPMHLGFALLAACRPPVVVDSPPVETDVADTDVFVDTDDTDDTDPVDTDTDPVDTDVVDTDVVDPAMPDFSLNDRNASSPRYGQAVSPRDYITKVSGFYFTHAT